MKLRFIINPCSGTKNNGPANLPGAGHVEKIDPGTVNGRLLPGAPKSIEASSPPAHRDQTAQSSAIAACR